MDPGLGNFSFRKVNRLALNIFASVPKLFRSNCIVLQSFVFVSRQALQCD